MPYSIVGVNRPGDGPQSDGVRSQAERDGYKGSADRLDVPSILADYHKLGLAIVNMQGVVIDPTGERLLYAKLVKLSGAKPD